MNSRCCIAATAILLPKYQVEKEPLFKTYSI